MRSTIRHLQIGTYQRQIVYIGLYFDRPGAPQLWLDGSETPFDAPMTPKAFEGVMDDVGIEFTREDSEDACFASYRAGECRVFFEYGVLRSIQV